ncbi:hypothetical protein ADUPG1_008947 [Aduncisulcus paluster]|uniref:Uncharacterized protein n=1 Tax=Aduncisulcus paluster TaxID=2918883 RepID=A0ABQ5KTU4_9EUKA|nr:hypothetical protein ADUPG1_008947 [Aduncisulcus paluster]
MSESEKSKIEEKNPSKKTQTDSVPIPPEERKITRKVSPPTPEKSLGKVFCESASTVGKKVVSSSKEFCRKHKVKEKSKRAWTKTKDTTKETAKKVKHKVF